MSVSIVWINILQGDSEMTARKSASIFNDPRVLQFYDPHRLSGKAIAESLGWKGRVAWDIYLFYAAKEQWVEDPPIPTAWMHQLRESWADPAHFYTGEDLARELFKTLEELLA